MKIYPDEPAFNENSGGLTNLCYIALFIYVDAIGEELLYLEAEDHEDTMREASRKSCKAARIFLEEFNKQQGE